MIFICVQPEPYTTQIVQIINQFELDTECLLVDAGYSNYINSFKIKALMNNIYGIRNPHLWPKKPILHSEYSALNETVRAWCSDSGIDEPKTLFLEIAIYSYFLRTILEFKSLDDLILFKLRFL